MNTQQKPGASTVPMPSPAPGPGQDARSESLLPVDEPDPNLEVAEEVSLDQQSSRARKVGAMPDETPVSKPAQALAETLSSPASSGTPPDP